MLFSGETMVTLFLLTHSRPYKKLKEKKLFSNKHVNCERTQFLRNTAWNFLLSSKCPILEPCHHAPRMPPQENGLESMSLSVLRKPPTDCPLKQRRANLTPCRSTARLWELGVCALERVRQVREQPVVRTCDQPPAWNACVCARTHTPSMKVSIRADADTQASICTRTQPCSHQYATTQRLMGVRTEFHLEYTHASCERRHMAQGFQAEPAPLWHTLQEMWPHALANFRGAPIQPGDGRGRGGLWMVSAQAAWLQVTESASHVGASVLSSQQTPG